MPLTCMIYGTVEGLQSHVQWQAVLVHVFSGGCVCVCFLLDQHVICEYWTKSQISFSCGLLQRLTGSWKQLADVTARHWIQPVKIVNCVASERLESESLHCWVWACAQIFDLLLNAAVCKWSFSFLFLIGSFMHVGNCYNSYVFLCCFWQCVLLLCSNKVWLIDKKNQKQRMV